MLPWTAKLTQTVPKSIRQQTVPFTLAVFALVLLAILTPLTRRGSLLTDSLQFLSLALSVPALLHCYRSDRHSRRKSWLWLARGHGILAVLVLFFLLARAEPSLYRGGLPWKSLIYFAHLQILAGSMLYRVWRPHSSLHRQTGFDVLVPVALMGWGLVQYIVLPYLDRWTSGSIVSLVPWMLPLGGLFAFSAIMFTMTSLDHGFSPSVQLLLGSAFFVFFRTDIAFFTRAWETNAPAPASASPGVFWVVGVLLLTWGAKHYVHCGDAQTGGVLWKRHDSVRSRARLPQYALLLLVTMPGFFAMERLAASLALVVALSLAFWRLSSSMLLENIAFYDTVTTLPNRHFLIEQLPKFRRRHRRRKRQVVLFLIDLRQLEKTSNLHAISVESMLRHVSLSLQTLANDRHNPVLLARDELHRFVITMALQPGVNVEEWCHKLQDLVQQAMALEFPAIMIRSRLSAAIDDGDQNPYTIITRAEIAMKAARHQGKNWQLFESKLKEEQDHRLALERELRNAIEEHALSLFIQPQLTTDNQAVIGGEILLRWQHHDWGWVSPGEFIPLAEQSSLIESLDRMVLEKTLDYWKTADSPWPIHLWKLSVNVTAQTLANPDFLPWCQNRFRLTVHSYRI